MSDCKQFSTEMLNRDGDPQKVDVRVSYDFGHDDSAMLVFDGPSYQAHIHTSKASVLALAIKIIKELG